MPDCILPLPFPSPKSLADAVKSAPASHAVPAFGLKLTGLSWCYGPDLFSRKVVGWAMDQSMERGLVIKALQMALLAGKPQQGLHHSDRGSQYASSDYQKLLVDNTITCSVSRKGNCYDNACMESFFATLKQELICHCQYRMESRQDISEYIQVGYNRKRRHSSLGYLSPEQFENQGHLRMAA
jgi:transposase InsO family protein